MSADINLPTLTGALSLFNDYLVGQKHPGTTIKAYSDDIRRWILWLPTITTIGYPSELTREDIEEYKTYLAREQGCETTTIRRKLASMKRFTKFLVDRGFLQTDIAERVRPPKLGTREPNFLTDKEYKTLLFEAQRRGSLRDYAMLQILVQTGIRVGELVRLKLTDIDWTIPQLVLKGRKHGVDTNLPMPRQAAESLRSYLAIRPPAPVEQVFLSKSARPLDERGVRYIVKFYLNKAGITKKASVHTLRHTYGTHKTAKGMTLKELQYLMGHKKAETTLRYVHLLTTRLKEAQEATSL